jgi:hypothetical protein
MPPRTIQHFQSSLEAFESLSEGAPVLADSIDLELHEARINRQKGKVTYWAPLNSLPDGCFVRIAGTSYLVWNGCLFRWSAAGYDEKLIPYDDRAVEALTPELIVKCLAHGYRPKVHDSLLAL